VKLFGRPAAELVDEALSALVHPDDAAVVGGITVAVAGPGKCEDRAEFRVAHPGGPHHVEAVSTNLLENEDVEGIVLNLRDISERKAFEAQLEHQAFHDPVTGLPNRALFGNRVAHALERRKRDGAQLAVLFLDLDDFKTVNDSLGHAAGDALLREVGRRLHVCVRGADTAARLGGDEFGVLIEETADELHAADVAERIMAALDAPVVLGDREVTVRTSVGIAFGDAADATSACAEELLRNADAAMYMAKEQGKGRYQVFEPEMHASALARLELKTDLARALDAREFSLRYQPVVDMESGAMTGVEALVRWEHPVRGVVSPAEFIPLAEDTGLIVPLGRQLLIEACREAAALQAACPRNPPLSMSVNLSARQLQRVELIDHVREALDRSGIEPQTLVLELTETLMMQDMDLAILRLHQLRELGVRLAIDDFGTGYSSLNSIRAFPIDLLKIDKSFLGSGEGDAAVPPLTAAILGLASVLDLRPVAEGIETPAQLARLRELGCPLGQGYLFARPMTGEEARAYAAEHAAVPAR
jgi:diguanylate cyclase (GGDEF)-like protein/PAS domain S-box-containing protein